MQSEVVIETRNLSKVYRDFWGRQKVRALKALDLEVRRGEVFGLLGPNGSGKTTTIKLLLGLLYPTSGQALVLGQDATEVAKNERIGYLPEESYLYRFLNAEETLDFYGRLFDIPRAKRRQRTADLIEMVGLTKSRRRQLREYSKGMTRLIGLAQALINDPEVIFLDEPTSGLDPIHTHEMKDLIRDLQNQGKTILMCSHLLADVQDVCDRIAILHQGELKELGRVDNLLKVRDVTEIRTSGLSPEAQEEIRQVVLKHNGTVHSIGNPTTTLEELFVRVIEESEAHPGRRVRAEQANRISDGEPASRPWLSRICKSRRSWSGCWAGLGRGRPLAAAGNRPAGGASGGRRARFAPEPAAKFRRSRAGRLGLDRRHSRGRVAAGAGSRGLVLHGEDAGLALRARRQPVLSGPVALVGPRLVRRGAVYVAGRGGGPDGRGLCLLLAGLGAGERAVGWARGNAAGRWRKFAIDIARISPRRVFALAWLAVRESLRRRVVVVFVVFVVLILFAALFIDKGSQHPAQLYIQVVLNFTIYLAMLFSLVLSALSLPADIRDRTLHTVVTKPVRKIEIVLGRVLGFVFVGTVLLLCHRLDQLRFHRAEPQSHAPTDRRHAAARGIAARQRRNAAAGHDEPVARARARGDDHRTTGVPAEATVEPQRDHTHDLYVSGSGDKAIYTLGPPEGQLQARVPIYGKLSFLNDTGGTKEKGINVGDEWTYRSFIRGRTAATAIWTFDGLSEDLFPESKFPTAFPWK